MADLVLAEPSGAVHFGLLGPLQVVDGAGAARAVPAGKQRIVLAALLLSTGSVVSAAGLAEALWDASPPPNAPAVMRTYVMRLRRALGPAGARIVGRPPGWAVELQGPEELDLAEVDRLWRAARAAGEAEQWRQVSLLLARALSLWRGEPLFDVPSAALARREAGRLSELRLQITEARVDADLRLGRHGELVAELRRMAAEHPLREHIRAQLMLACYRCGHQAAALEVYRDARGTLADELGVEPGRELHEMHQRILAADPELTAGTPAKVAVRRPEDDYPQQVEPEKAVPRQPPAAVPHFTGRAAEPRGLIAADVPVPRLLPPAVSHFVGRTDVLKTLNEFAGDAGRHSEAVLISAIGGLAGIGKTALAVHWAHQVADQFPGGQLYVDLRGFSPDGSPVTSAEAIRGFLDALGMPAAQMPAGLDARMARYRSLLAGQRMLVVLDNARDATQVRPLLPGSPGCLVIVTSRNQLDGLAASTGARLLALGVLSEADSRELLAAIVGSERAGAEPDAIGEVAGLCGRLPLALAIAAARTAARPGLPLAALAAELRDTRDRLDALDAGDPATSVRAVFSWSSDQLTGSAARLFRLVGVHPGPDITAPAAASLAGTGPAQARRDLAELARACLVTEHDPGRYGMHDLLRAYASEQARAGDADAACRAATGRVLDHYLHTARAASVLLNPLREQQITLPAPQPGVAPERLADGRHALAWFEAEHRVLLAAAGLAGRDGFDACAWQLPWAMAEFLDRRGHWDEQLAIERAGLAAAERLGDKAGQAVARRLLAYTCARRGDNEQARACLAPCLELYRQLGDRDGQARVRQSLSYVANQQGHYADAIGHDQQALVLFRATGHRVGQAAALNNIGWNHALLGDLEQARVFCQQALALHRELASPGVPHTWDTLGYIEHQLGRYGEAATCYQNALAIFREQGYRFYQADTLTHLGDTHHAAGDRHQARQAWEQALDILDDLRHSDADQVRAKLR